MAVQAPMLRLLEAEALQAYIQSSPSEHQTTRTQIEEARETNIVYQKKQEADDLLVFDTRTSRYPGPRGYPADTTALCQGELRYSQGHSPNGS